MMNTNHNNISEIKQDQRENQINQVDRDPTFSTWGLDNNTLGKGRGVRKGYEDRRM